MELPKTGGSGAVEFKLLPLTHDVEEKLLPLQTSLEEVQADENATTRDRVVTMAKQFDVILVKQDEKAPDASKLIADLYDAGETTFLAVSRLVWDCVDAGRPT